MTDLSALIARLEAAEVGNRGMDGAICAALGQQPEWATKNHAPTQPQLWTDGKPGLRAREWLCPKYTTSLDAALALADRVLPGWPCWGVATDIPGRIGAVLAKSNRDEGVTGYASHPALALVIAILRAKQGEGE